MGCKFTRFGHQLSGLAFLLFLLFLGGCAATVATPHLYLLTGAPTMQSASDVLPESCAPVAVTVQLPAYLQREGLVLQLRDHELVAADNHLWAEPLVYGVERLLEVCLNPKHHDATDPGDRNAVQQVGVVVEELHGNASGDSRLQATWSKRNATNGVASSSRRFSAHAQQSEPGYGAMVSVQRGLLLDLCQQITRQLAHCTE